MIVGSSPPPQPVTETVQQTSVARNSCEIRFLIFDFVDKGNFSCDESKRVKGKTSRRNSRREGKMLRFYSSLSMTSLFARVPSAPQSP